MPDTTVSLWLDTKKYPKLTLPTRGSALASGYDLCAAEDAVVGSTHDLKDAKVVHTGVWLAYLDPAYEIQIRPRSGNSLKRKFIVANTPGTVDADYRGEIGIIVWYYGPGELQIKAGEKLAQMVVSPVIRPELRAVSDEEFKRLSDTQRGAAGYGSTGR